MLTGSFPFHLQFKDVEKNKPHCQVLTFHVDYRYKTFIVGTVFAQVSMKI